MIQLGGAAVLCREAADDPDACAPSERRGQLGLEMGLRLATHCLDRHTASGAGGAFEAGSMWEYIDDEGDWVVCKQEDVKVINKSKDR